MKTNPNYQSEADERRGQGGEKKDYTVPPGRYRLTVAEAQEMTSRVGNPMMKLTLEGEYSGQRFLVFEYLVFHVQWKIEQFCRAAGIMAEFHEGEITEEDCTGCIVEADLTRSEGDEKYGPQNRVRTFIPAEETVPKNVESTKPLGEDDIPF